MEGTRSPHARSKQVHERIIIQSLTQENSTLRRERNDAINRLDEISGSLAWILIQKARNTRATVFKEGTRRGRYWALSARFLKTAARSGIRVALRKALHKIEKKFGGRRWANDDSSRASLPSTLSEKAPGDRFRSLPWRFTGEGTKNSSPSNGHFKLLLVAHSACRTGAPLCLLQLTRELSRFDDFDCHIVLQQGGELAESFARIAPTLAIEDLVTDGVRREDVPHLVARTFREYSSRGVVVCNTVAVSAFHEACSQQKIPVLSWIHELPSFIDSLGGVMAIERIKAASRKIMVPAEFVRRALISSFSIDPGLIRTVYNGQAPKTRGMARATQAQKVREELGLPADARIVLSCGTVDLRKGADLFVNVARKLLTDPAAAELAPKTWFIWVGHCVDESFLRWLIHDAAIGELEDKIRFIGPRADTSPYFLAADVFALTSREDPCPLVNFEAMESGLAVVAFEGAGGAPEVLGGGGISVPYIDVEAMARSLLTLLADPHLRGQMGSRGQLLIRDRFTWSRFTKEFLDILRINFEYRPAQTLRVSVIVPNFRHEQYLEERLRSIFRQSRKPHEIIFLDDASPDGSVAVARRLAAESPVPMRIIVNEQNSGSTFRQWMKGLRLATGDLIWLAESDDSCHPEFLERLVPEFYDPELALGYCQSALIGPRGETLAENFLGHTDDISTARWLYRFCVSGTEEAQLALCQKNTIPNASAVVFRRPTRLDFEQELEKLRFAGDWFFYAMLIRSGKIVYLPEVLNYYRRHQQTVTHQSIREETHALETLHVKARVFETFKVPLNAMAESLGRTVLEYNQLSQRLDLKRPALTSNPHLTPALNRIRAHWQEQREAGRPLKILFIVPDLKSGAFTIANLHLANALAREHSVFLCNAQPDECDPNLVLELGEDIILLEGTLGQNAWTMADRHDAGHRSRVLQELIRFHQIDLIHSRSWPADRLALSLKDELKIPWLLHLDGYRAFFDRYEADADSIRTATEIISSANGLFYEREGDLGFLVQRASFNRKRAVRVALGFRLSALDRFANRSVREPDGAIRFFLITSEHAGEREARDAIAAVRTVNSQFAGDGSGRHARLVLVAQGPAADSLEQQFSDDDRIEVYKGPTESLAILALCDIALNLHGSATVESSSFAVAALAFGQPILTIDQGPIPEMIEHDGKHAGLLIPSHDTSTINMEPLVAAIKEYVLTPELLADQAKTARSLFEARFTVDRIAATCAEAYIAARNLLPFPDQEEPRVAKMAGSPPIPTRRLA